ncbi:MAG: hypothetical protein J6N76_00010 [Lachnospiraceae bacterium]|nr:hypothetical protein [Lachnospiraceae bacterium]
MYRGVLIDADNSKDYLELIPKELFAELKAHKLQAAAMIDEMRESDNIIGVVFIQPWDGWLEIRWVELSPYYDTDDYGADLIWNVTEFVRGWDTWRGVYAKIYPSEKKQLSYYRMAGFKIREDMDNVFEFRFGDVITDGILSNEGDFEHCRSLEGMEDWEKRKLESMLYNAPEPVAVEFPVSFDKYDGSLSTFYEEDGIIKGMILISSREDCISVDYAYAVSPVIFVTILAYICQWAELIMSEDQRILVPVLSWKGAELVKKLVPNAKRDPVYTAIREYEIKRK